MLIVKLRDSNSASAQRLLEQPLQEGNGFSGFVQYACGDKFDEKRMDFGETSSNLPAGDKSQTLHTRFEEILQRFAPSRASALQRLAALDVVDYGKTRNYLHGGVSQLSPFIESGLLSETEVLEFLQSSLKEEWPNAYRFVQQLCWREFFQQKWRRDFMAPKQSQQVYKTGWQDGDYQTQMPGFIEHAKTDSALINQLIVQLQTTGFLHNHGRLYLASYVVHWCRVHWQTGAQWMMRYLVDSNLASNHFSWQWVASTNSPKPYFFNLENAQRFCGEEYDTSEANNPSLVASYETLHARLFPNLEVAVQ